MNGITLLLLLIIYIGSAQCALRVIGGRDADEQEFRYVVRLEIHLRLSIKDIIVVHAMHVCTAAMLTPTWALTAAHCITDSLDFILTNSTQSRLQVVLRVGPISNPSLNTLYEVIAAIKHPGYRERLNVNVINDVGLLRTQRVLLPEFAKLSAVDFSSLHGHEATLVGFGNTNSSNGKLLTTLELKKNLQVLDVILMRCSEDEFPMMPRLCVARRCGQSASLCSGDSGGPALHSSGIVGVNSLAARQDCHVKKDRDRSKIVVVLTPISPFIDWISNNIIEADLQEQMWHN